jgi:hypothetical protein
MGETPKHTEGSPRYMYGSKEEVADRLEGGYGPTESHFTQIRPSTSGGGANSINEQSGSTKNNRAKITHRAGKG